VTYPYFANNLAMTPEGLLIAQYLADQMARMQECEVPDRIMVVGRATGPFLGAQWVGPH
jgi:hypothetical protein